jgi:hypothetical protein
MTANITLIESILRNRFSFFDEIRSDIDLPEKITGMAVACTLSLAAYGAVMGISHGLLQAVSSFFKLPLLFLATLLICTPSLHFFNILFGSRQTLMQTIALILTAMTTTSVLMLSFAPITLFFLLTSSQYEFFKLLNVIFFAAAGAMGIVFLRQGIRAVTEDDNANGAQTRRMIFAVWVVLYAFVGTQMAWTLSPFIGDPGQPFIVLNQVGGNFYADVIASLSELLWGF